VPLTTDRAVITSSVLMIKALASQMKTTIDAIAEFDREIETLCQTHADYFIFDSLPGSGTVYSSRLLAALGTDRSRWTSVDDLLCFSGVAPVIERSGKQERIRWRYFCPKFLRQSFIEYAGESIKQTFLGQSLLLFSTRTRQKSSSGSARISLQMDPDYLSVLADKDGVQ